MAVLIDDRACTCRNKLLDLTHRNYRRNVLRTQFYYDRETSRVSRSIVIHHPKERYKEISKIIKDQNPIASTSHESLNEKYVRRSFLLLSDSELRGVGLFCHVLPPTRDEELSASCDNRCQIVSLA